MRPSRVNINLIAERAGVARTTVSRALNDRPDISAETKARIRAVAAELGYSPSPIARSLVTQRTYTIGLAIATMTDVWVTEVAPAIEESLSQAGYDLFLGTFSFLPDRERRVLDGFRSRQVDGIMVLGSVGGAEYGALQAEWDIPIVLIGPLQATAHRFAVLTDDRCGARLATAHLASLGHRRIAHIAGPPELLSAHDRARGYGDALAAAGIHADPALTVVGDRFEEGGMAGVRALIALPDRPTAVFCYNDMTALGALRGARSLGLRVPDDLSLVGFDDVHLARYVDPPLTTIRQEAPEIGRLAAQMLLDLIAGGETDAPLTLPVHLVVRESAARPQTG